MVPRYRVKPSVSLLIKIRKRKIRHKVGFQEHSRPEIFRPHWQRFYKNKFVNSSNDGYSIEPTAEKIHWHKFNWRIPIELGIVQMLSPFVICNGLIRSGSTWSFNVCRLLMELRAWRRGETVQTGYLDGRD